MAKISFLSLSALALMACAGPSQSFTDNLQTLCGNIYQGAVVSDDPEDADWREEVLTLGPITCSDTQIAMPLAVGDDTSRTWFLEPTSDGLYFYHRHLHTDGTPDDVTGYGGTDPDPQPRKASFPVDTASIANFRENGLDASVTNIWTFAIQPGETLAYELNREGRHFRAEFDLTMPQSSRP